MKTRYCLLALLSYAMISCNPKHEHVNSDPLKTTTLSKDQVEKLLPFMTDLKKDGEVVMKNDSVRSKDGHVMNHHQNSQNYTFTIMVDDNDRPIMPGDSIALRRPVGRRPGGFQTMCMGSCLGDAGGFPCVVIGCAPIDNSCGCTPLTCGACEVLDCSSSVIGWVMGGAVMM